MTHHTIEKRRADDVLAFVPLNTDAATESRHRDLPPARRIVIQRRTMLRKQQQLDEMRRKAVVETLDRIQGRVEKLHGLDLQITFDLLDSILQEVSPRRRDRTGVNADANDQIEILDAADICERHGFTPRNGAPQ